MGLYLVTAVQRQKESVCGPRAGGERSSEAHQHRSLLVYVPAQ
jgi:hypothetical protein